MHVTIFIFIFFPLFSYLYRLVAARGIEENIFLGFQFKKKYLLASLCFSYLLYLGITCAQGKNPTVQSEEVSPTPVFSSSLSQR